MDNTELMQQDELQHHGIPGMKWGVRRYQNKDGSLTNAGRKRYGDEDNGSKPKASFKERMAAKKKAKETAARNKARVEAMQKGKEAKKKQAEEEAKQQAANEAKKKEVLASRSAKAIHENAHLFTNEELNAAYNRLTLERNIAQLAPKEVSKGEQFVNNMINAGRKVNDIYDVGSKLYNNAAKLHNSLSDKDDKWPLIGEGGKDEKSGGAFDLNKAYKNVDKMSDDDLKRAAQRAENRSKVTKAWEDEQKRKTQTNSKTDDKADDKTDDKSNDNQNSGKKDETETKSDKKDKTGGNAKGEKAGKWEKTEKTVYSGTVEGKGTSTSNLKNGSDWFNSKDWDDVPYAYYRESNAIVPVVNTGSSWVAGYLEDLSR